MELLIVVTVILGLAGVVMIPLLAPSLLAGRLRQLANRGAKLPDFIYRLDLHTTHLLPLLHRGAVIEEQGSNTLSIQFSEGGYAIDVSWKGRSSSSGTDPAVVPSSYYYRINYQIELASRLPEGVRLTTLAGPSSEQAQRLPGANSSSLSWSDVHAPGGEVTAAWAQAITLLTPPNTRDDIVSHASSRPYRPDRLHRTGSRLQCVYSGVTVNTDAREFVAERIEDQIRYVVALARLCEWWDQDSLEAQCVAHVLEERDASMRSLALQVLVSMYAWELSREPEDEDEARHPHHGEVIARFFDAGLEWDYGFIVGELRRSQLDAMGTGQLRDVVEQTGDETAAKQLERRLELCEMLDDTAFTMERRIALLGEAARGGDELDLEQLTTWLGKLPERSFGGALIALMGAPDHAIWSDAAFEHALGKRLARVEHRIHQRTYTAWRRFSHASLPMVPTVERIYRALFDDEVSQIPLDWGLELIGARDASDLQLDQIKRLMDSTSSARVSEFLLTDEVIGDFEALVMLTGSVLGERHRHEVLSSPMLRMAAITRFVSLCSKRSDAASARAAMWLEGIDELFEVLLIQEMGDREGIGGGMADNARIYVDHVERTGVRKRALGALFAVAQAAPPRMRADLELVSASWTQKLGGAHTGALTHVEQDDRVGGLSTIERSE